ncbi:MULTISPECIES: hypothetical protein [unclassified Modestobacter]|uniref:hypothetical protein n=1 Tax=unclassified Modestobacter TaxID=2643866 RepID=UPI0022AA065B|nr:MULTISPECIES: hypothetical protein [unclassified Modestobacter]MCZ2826077.1 hypothetical protein [Modestobacter sp. VKM Ac-2981]MCZ2852858.1 hypothetical protein [Modestobacter sp. VKM Ac-2982]
MVVLRSERNGDDSRYLRAQLNESGDLVLEGEDYGPATAPVSSDGEYEWVQVVAADKLPELLQILGADPAAGVIEELAARWSGAGSYQLERLLRETGLSTVHVF